MLSVVIPTHRPSAIDGVLDGLARQTCSSFEVIVVENGSATETLGPRLARYRDVLDLKYGHLVEPGLNRARNFGAEQSQHPLIALLDDDCVPREGWVRSVLDHHQRYPDAGVIGGRVNLVFSASPPAWLQGEFRRSLAELNWGDRSGPLGRWQHLVGSNLSFSRKVFRRVGGFQNLLGLTAREHVVRANDETEFVIHASLRGRPGAVYAADMSVDHLIADSRVDFQWMLRRRFGQGVSDIEQELMLLGREAAQDRLAASLLPATWHLDEHERCAAAMDARERPDFRLKYMTSRVVYLIGSRERLCRRDPAVGRLSVSRRADARAAQRGKRLAAGLNLRDPDGKTIQSLRTLIYRDRSSADPGVAVCFLAGVFQEVFPLRIEDISKDPEAAA